MKNVSSLAIVAFLLLMAAFASGQQKAPESTQSAFALSLRPSFNIPLGPNTDVFGLGGGVGVDGEYRLPFLPAVRVMAQLGYSLTSVKANTSISALDIGVGLHGAQEILPRLEVGASLQGGYFYSFLNDQSITTGIGSPESGGGNPYLQGAVGVQYLLSPELGLSLGVGYRTLLGFYDELRVTTGISYHFKPASSSILEQELRLRPVPLDTLVLSETILETVFPVFHAWYDDHPIGKARIRNRGRQALSGVKVSFSVPQFMDGPKQAAVVDHLDPEEEAEIILFGLFTDKILGLSEGTKVSAQIIVEASEAGRNYRNETATTLRLYDRNALSWDDDRKAAAFVTTKDPVILRFSRHATGVTQNKASRALNGNLLKIAAVHTAIRDAGLSYVVDPSSAYRDFSKNKTAVDFLQFPRQTLLYGAGDCDDLSVLFSALLESVGVATAFITTPGHIFLAASIDMDPASARQQFLRPQDLIFRDGRSWLPLEVTQISGGFVKAWDDGAREWRESSANGQAALYPLDEAWEVYAPVGLPGEGEPGKLPDPAQLAADYQREVRLYVDRELTPQVARLQDQVKTQKWNPVPLNKLGVLYARYGMVNEAEEQFQVILSKNEYVPALINAGNLSWLASDYARALDLYQRAARSDPRNTAALLGIARGNHQIENFASARNAYARLKELSPELAERFAYLNERGEASTRASNADKEKEVVVWQE